MTSNARLQLLSQTYITSHHIASHQLSFKHNKQLRNEVQTTKIFPNQFKPSSTDTAIHSTRTLFLYWSVVHFELLLRTERRHKGARAYRVLLPLHKSYTVNNIYIYIYLRYVDKTQSHCLTFRMSERALCSKMLVISVTVLRGFPMSAGRGTARAAGSNLFRSSLTCEAISIRGQTRR